MKGLPSPGYSLTQLSLLCILTSAVNLQAQFVVGTPPSSRAVSYAPSGSSSRTADQQSNISSVFTKLEPLAIWGPLTLRPYVNYSIVYGDGILRVPGEPENTTIQTFTAGVGTRIGQYTDLDYSITQTLYSSRLLENNAGDSASVRYSRSYEDWRWGFSQSYSSGKPFLVETARQTDHTTYSTGLNVGYSAGDRTQLSLNAVRSVRLAGPSASSVGWTGSDWVQWSSTASVNYAFSARLSGGVSMGYGYDEVSATSDMSSFRPSANLSWQPTNKLSISLQRGVERRKIEGDGSGYIDNPVYSTSMNYRLFPTTSFFASGSRNVSVSYFSEQLTRGIQWSVGMEQRLLQRYFMTGSFSHGNTDYVSTGTRADSGRDDSYEAYSFKITTQFLRRGTVGVTYDISKNSSTLNGFTFKSHQIGGNIGYRF